MFCCQSQTLKYTIIFITEQCVYAVPSQDEPLCRNGTRASVFYYFENGRVGISVSCLYSLRPESYIAAS